MARQASRLSIRFSARAVVARGEPFRPWSEALSDAGVALDEISSLRPRQEPLVLRVDASGGTSRERSSVEGDWLCDSDGSPPRRLPKPRWTFDDESARWSSSRTWVEAWEECRDARWSLHAAASVGVDRRLVVAAACACARTSLRFAKGSAGPAKALIEEAEAWARGEASAARVANALGQMPLEYNSYAGRNDPAAQAVWRVANAAASAAMAIHYSADDAARSAAEAAQWSASSAAIDATRYATSVASAADMWREATDAYLVTMSASLLRMVAEVKHAIPTVSVLIAAAVG